MVYIHECIHRFLERAIEGLLDYDEEDLEAPEGECPVCGDRTFAMS